MKLAVISSVEAPAAPTDRFATWYSDSPLLRVLLATVEAVGSAGTGVVGIVAHLMPYLSLIGVTDILLTGRAQAIAEERLQHLHRSLRSDLEKVDEAKVDRAYFASEEWHDLLLWAIIAAARLRDRERAEHINNAMDRWRGITTHNGLHCVPVDVASPQYRCCGLGATWAVSWE